MSDPELSFELRISYAGPDPVGGRPSELAHMREYRFGTFADALARAEDERRCPVFQWYKIVCQLWCEVVSVQSERKF